jgi:tetratricopeptide (TPR) repeat protein
MAWSTVFTYKGKQVDPRKDGQELSVRAVLTGQVMQKGETLSVQVELVDTSDGARLWAERYDRTLADLAVIEADMTRRISEKLRYRLTAEEQERLTKPRTVSAEAYKLYFKGQHYLNNYNYREEGFKKAIDYFNRAINEDPNFALAYVGIANFYDFESGDVLPANEAMPRSRQAARKAVWLDETLAEAHAALAQVTAFYDWDWAGAERGFRRALELNPGLASARNQYGILLIDFERFAEAQIQMDRAHQLDPLSPGIHVGTVWPDYFARRYDQALERLRVVIALNPDFTNAHFIAGWAYTQKGMYDEAIASFRKARSLGDFWPPTAWLGYAYAKAGQRAEAQKALAELKDRSKERGYVSDYGLAVIYAGLGEKDQAFAALERVYQARDVYMHLVKVDPSLDNLRTDPRFADLLRRINF